jgi:hypothetical protein
MSHILTVLSREAVATRSVLEGFQQSFSIGPLLNINMYIKNMWNKNNGNDNNNDNNSNNNDVYEVQQATLANIY